MSLNVRILVECSLWPEHLASYVFISIWLSERLTIFRVSYHRKSKKSAWLSRTFGLHMQWGLPKNSMLYFKIPWALCLVRVTWLGMYGSHFAWTFCLRHFTSVIIVSALLVYDIVVSDIIISGVLISNILFFSYSCLR